MTGFGLRFMMLLGLTAPFCGARALASGTETSVSPNIGMLARLPGTTVTHEDKDGVERTTYDRNGVSVIVEQRDGESFVSGWDKTGRGAVLCTHMIVAEVRDYVRACEGGAHPKLVRELGESLDDMNAFIAANSVPPTQKVDVARAAEQRFLQKYGETRSIKRRSTCAGSSVKQLLPSFLKQSEDERRRAVKDLLAVPRLPVVNPCL